MAKNRKLNLRNSAHFSLRQKVVLGILTGGLILAGILATLKTEQSQSDVSAFDSMSLKGNAVKNSDGSFTLTPNAGGKAGAAWFAERISLNNSFIFEMDINFGSSDYGADGIAFVFQNSSSKKNAIGTGGGGQGYAGITPSLTIEFDTYYNGSSVHDLADDHISYIKNGNQGNVISSTACISPSCANVEDGATHSVKIEWIPDSHTLNTYYEGNLRVSYTGDIVTSIFSGQEWVYFGMTAATGGATNLQKFFPTAFQATGESNSFPVEWLYIDAKEENGNGVVTWGTAKELNADYFAVERSTDGQEFKELDRVAAAGTSNERLDYSFTDYQISAVKNYYRLRQVDYDGQFNYSDVVELSLNAANIKPEIHIWPNPAKTMVHFTAKGFSEKGGQATAISITGQQIWKGTISAGAEQELDVSSWPRGTYYFTITDGTNQARQTLVVE
ncbi:MAG: T9SS type A sorting domain-containing protein [Bacteroidia bacterium]